MARGAFGLGLCVLLALLVGACGSQEDDEGLRFSGTEALPPPPVGDLKFEVPPPPFKEEDIFPCTECHDNEDLEPDPRRRKLTMMHENIVLKHDAEHRWCLDCHDAENRDSLRLANGTLVPFTESYRLCGQCHGDKYRDWRVGVHGRRKGFWNGKKQYLLCVYCHDSHSPRFKPLAPLPPPKRPEAIR
ncbi:MAG: hypothetical protein ACC662_05560 [Planctomycetota bacterium]